MSDLLRQAIDAKTREIGTKYTYRDLAQDSNTHWTTVDKVMRGERHPSAEVIHAWSRALTPYLPEDEALVAAGYAPVDPVRLRLLERIARLPRTALDALDERLGLLFSDLTPEQQAQYESERRRQNEGPADKPTAGTERESDRDVI